MPPAGSIAFGSGASGHVELDVEGCTLKHDLTEYTRSVVIDGVATGLWLVCLYFVIDGLHHLAERMTALIASVFVDARQPGIVIGPRGTIQTEVAGTYKRDGTVTWVELCLTERHGTSDV